jgi:hypothetical protein
MDESAHDRNPLNPTKILELIGTLIRRPGRGEIRKGGKRCGLPLMCLVWQQSAVPRHGQRTSDDCYGLLRAVRLYLNESTASQVPSCLITLPYVETTEQPPRQLTERKDVDAVRAILRQCADQLAGGRETQGVIRYPLFQIADTLMGPLAGAAEQQSNRGDRREELRRQLSDQWWQQHSALRKAIGATQQVTDAASAAVEPPPKIGGWAGFLVLLAGRLAKLVLRVSRGPRWFAHQPFMQRNRGGDLVDFLIRLTKDRWPEQDQQQVCLLLVNAFLEDLRRAYRCRRGRRRPAWHGRRRTYPVLLLNGADEVNGGYRLLSLISKVRTETRLFDPLLVVSAGWQPPPESGSDYSRGYTPEQVHKAWASQFQKNSRVPGAWYMPVPAPDRISDEQYLVRTAEPIKTRRPSLLFAAKYQLLAAAIIAFALGPVGYQVYGNYAAEHCGVGWLDGSFGSWDPATWMNHNVWSLRQIGNECVGVSDGTYQFLPVGSTKSLLTVEQKIALLNQQAENLHRQYGSRPYFTVVYLGSLTNTSGADLGAEREELEGVAAAQWSLLQTEIVTQPIMRVLIANAGTGLLQGQRVAAMIGKYVSADPSIVAVVGLDQSRQATLDTIKALAVTKMPVIAATLSADVLAGQPGKHAVTPYYFQIAPQNWQEARFAAYFAKNRLHTAQRSAWIYYSNQKSDIYSTSLGRDALAAFKKAGFSVRGQTFTPSPPGQLGRPGQLGSVACRLGGVVFFAGRQEDFQAFLGGLYRHCSPNGKEIPPIIGDDDVARFVADPAQPANYTGISFYYVSFVTGRQNCANADSKDLYGYMNSLFSFDCGSRYGAVVDGHAALTWDAAQIVISAVEDLRSSPSPVAVWTAIDSGEASYLGESGGIQFGRPPNGNVPQQKAIVMELVRNSPSEPPGTAPDPQALCGQPGRDGLPVQSDGRSLSNAQWCPAVYDAAPLHKPGAG